MNSGKWIFHDRGFAKNLVYFPGWATDISFLLQDKLPYNLIYPESLLIPAHLPELANQLTTPTLAIGWSMGGFMALQFTRQYPDKISSLAIASLRQQYPPELISPMRCQELPDMRRVQREFYKQAFFPSMLAAYHQFKQGETALIDSMDHASLLTGLDYLENNSPGDAPAIPIIYLHGGKDIIAPVNEGTAWAEKNNIEYTVIPDAPHILPSSNEFYDIINDRYK